MAEYRTKEGDVLDDICFRHYGYESAVTGVLAANPGLADLGPVYSAGAVMDLPDLPLPSSETVKLWD